MDYARYLSAKETVDDRALNERVLCDLEHVLHEQSKQTGKTHVLRVLEVGAGIGAMCTRLLRRNTFSGFNNVNYVLLDIKADVLQAARKRLLEIGQPHGRHLDDTDEPTDVVIRPSASVTGTGSVHHQGSNKAEDEMKLPPVAVTEGFNVSFHIGDALEYVKSIDPTFDLVIGAAVLDIWPLRKAVSSLLSSLGTDGMRAFYFPINFDGTTHFYPPSSEGALFDTTIENLFHQAMGMRETFDHDTLAAHTGRHVGPVISQSGASVQSSGSSSWMVIPSKSPICENATTDTNAGFYRADEAYFLHCIVDFIRDSVPTTVSSAKKDWHTAFERYIASRRRQIQHGELFYVAHNIDVVGCIP